MRRRLFTSLAAATAVAASLLISGIAPASADPATAATTADGQSSGATLNTGVADGIRVKDTTLKIVAALRGVGKQVYECNSTGGYTLREPVAVLYGPRGVPAAIHGLGPFWANLDGSKVVGTSPVSAPSPGGPSNIPWLLVTAASNAGPGVFSNVKFIQRLDTRGGVAPTTRCTGPVAVDYSADYVFWAKP
jgi:hypothetical protein